MEDETARRNPLRLTALDDRRERPDNRDDSPLPDLRVLCRKPQGFSLRVVGVPRERRELSRTHASPPEPLQVIPEIFVGNLFKDRVKVGPLEEALPSILVSPGLPRDVRREAEAPRLFRVRERAAEKLSLPVDGRRGRAFLSAREDVPLDDDARNRDGAPATERGPEPLHVNLCRLQGAKLPEFVVALHV